MTKPGEPIVLELAALGREQMGPFLILGVEKDAPTGTIEENWAERLKWARRQLIKMPLEDINWAREILSDKERRIRADVGSLNLDTADRSMERLLGRLAGPGNLGWTPLDVEKPLAEYTPPAERIDVQSVRASLTQPNIPQETPAVVDLLGQLTETNLDPWDPIFSLELRAAPAADTQELHR